MAPQADYNRLVKVGLEGFAMVDEYWYPKQQPKYPQKQEPQMKQEVPIDCYEAAKQYGGMGVVDFKREPQMKQEVPIDCYKAAKQYGGMGVVDFKRKPLRAVY